MTLSAAEEHAFSSEEEWELLADLDFLFPKKAAMPYRNFRYRL